MLPHSGWVGQEGKEKKKGDKEKQADLSTRKMDSLNILKNLMKIADNAI